MRRLLVRDASILAAATRDCDALAWLGDRQNVALAEGDDVALFEADGAGVFAVHVLFRSRGRAALTLMGYLLDAMRDLYGARTFWAAIPAENRAARWFARQMRFRSRGLIGTPRGMRELFISEIG